MVGGGGAQGRRGQARCPGAELPGIEKAVETGPGSWGRGHVFCSPPGAEGLQVRTKAGRWSGACSACWRGRVWNSGARQPWV